MTLDGWLSIGVTLAALGAMAARGVAAYRALTLALAVMVLADVVRPERALQGFSNQGVATVALLFLVAGGVRRSGALESLVHATLGSARYLRVALLRMMAPVAALSAFVNNTPVVAMMMPDVRRWGEERGIAPSLLLIPLSYAAILGGMCTLIGTSTNLLVDGMLVDRGLGNFELFTISPLALIAAAAGIAVLVVFASVLLPRTGQRDLPLADPREFTAEMIVAPDGPLAGKRLADVSVPNLRRFAPVEIQRATGVIAAPAPSERLESGDRLIFAAPSAAILAVHRVAGLTPADVGGAAPSGDAVRVEAVIGPRCKLIGTTAGDGSFREAYGAAVIALARDGRQVPARGVGAWIIEAGDVVLLETDRGFSDRHRYGSELILVSAHGSARPHVRWHAPVSLVLMAAMATVAALGWTSMFVAALGAACAMLVLGVLTWSAAGREVDARVLLAIVAAIGLGAALEDSGAAAVVADGLVSLGGDSPHLTLALVYLATALCTELVTNNAAAVLMVPISLSAAAGTDSSHMPFIAVVMIAASASFVTPIGYQTNLMVYGPGGYRFGDFVRAGLPVSLVVGAVTVGFAPHFFPF